MANILQQMLTQLKPFYAEGCEKAIEELDKALTFESFDSEKARALGNTVVDCSKKYNGELAIVIIRETDNTVIYRYVADNCTERNIGYAMGKRNTVLKTMHSSLWALAVQATRGGLDELFADDSQCLPVGGSFPILVNGDLAYTLSVSGLKDGDDYRVVKEAVEEYLNIKIDDFSGKLI